MEEEERAPCPGEHNPKPREVPLLILALSQGLPGWQPSSVPSYPTPTPKLLSSGGLYTCSLSVGSPLSPLGPSLHSPTPSRPHPFHTISQKPFCCCHPHLPPAKRPLPASDLLLPLINSVKTAQHLWAQISASQGGANCEDEMAKMASCK